MRAYRPRRAAKYWLEGAPEWVLECQAQGKNLDCIYIIYLGGTMWLATMGRNVQFLQLDMAGGNAVWGRCKSDERGMFGIRIHWLDMPRPVRGSAVHLVRMRGTP